MSSQRFDLDRLVEVGVRTIRTRQQQIKMDILADPGAALEVGKIGARQKKLLTVDLVAERNTSANIRKGLSKAYNIKILGEESLSNPNEDLSDHDGLVVLLDMVDGTDLLERGLSNWCSAMVFYYPPERRILAALVGLPDFAIFYARDDREGAFRINTPRKDGLAPQRLRGPSTVRTLGKASLAFYGQQLSHLMPLLGKGGFFTRIAGKLTGRPAMRIYSLAGNPMMIRVVDGHHRIDAVFELQGQYPHDVVPGAYIAEKAGAVFQTLRGSPSALCDALLRPADPKSKFKYVVASTASLAKELRNCLGQ